MRFEIITIFPGFFSGFLENGILRRALSEGLVGVGVHDLRGFTHDRHRTVDDRPFGGGEGMVLKPGPLAEALESLGVMRRRVGGSAIRRSGEDDGDSCNPTHAAEKRVMDGAPQSVAGTEKATANATADPSAALRFAQDGISINHAEDDSANKQAESTAREFSGAGTGVILLSAQGRPFTQAMARELAGLERVVLICGRYEGVD
ncbi:MAG: hypothetical protein WCA11_07440, partial [Terracidiphilus sp.]